MLATGEKVEDDARKLVISLRQGVKFHNGESFTADDVAFTIDRVKMEGSDMAYTVGTVKEVKKIDDLIKAKEAEIMEV